MDYPPKPNEAFFNQDPVAAEVRRLTLIGIGACISRLHEKEDPTTEVQLFGVVEALQKWRIEEDMHARKSTEDTSDERERRQIELLSSPRLAAEFVAGQFLTHLMPAEREDDTQHKLLQDLTNMLDHDGAFVQDEKLSNGQAYTHHLLEL